MFHIGWGAKCLQEGSFAYVQAEKPYNTIKVARGLMSVENLSIYGFYIKTVNFCRAVYASGQRGTSSQ